jgi:outer membrane lipoprotein-sorting protein
VRKIAKFVLVLSALLFYVPAGAQNGNNGNKGRPWDQDTFLNALNHAAERFRTLTANLEFTKVTAVVDHKEVQSGRLYYRKDNRIKIEMTEPEPKEILFDGKRAQIYYPKMKQIQEFNLSKHKDMIEQFLLLGFGTKGDDLKDSYLITILGETQLYGRAALQVVLTPKDIKIRNSIHKIHIWFDLASWAPLQQKFFEVGGDYTTTRYTAVKVNVPRRRLNLKLSAPRGTTRVKPQGGASL